MTPLLTKDPEIDEIMALCKAKTKVYCQVFHPTRFYAPFSRKHDELFEILDDPTLQKVLVVAHRGFGKTSLFNYAVPAKALVFKETTFIVPVSESSSHAVEQSENLKRELERNTKIKAVIGDIRSTNNTYSKEEWITDHGVKVLPRGQGQQIRGRIFDDERPGLIIVDDLEDKKSVQNPDLRKELKSWFFTDLMNSIDRRKDENSATPWRILVIGTILHEAALLEDLRIDSTWTVLNAPLCDEQFKSYWPSFMPDKQVKALKKELDDQGLTHEFYLEYMNNPTPAEDAVFRSDMFRYYSEETEDDKRRMDKLENVVILDPAKTEKVHNAFTAIVGVAIDPMKNCIYVRDIVNAHLRPLDIYNRVFEMAEKINAGAIGFEVTGLSEFIKQPLTDEMFRRGKHYDLVELHARRGQGEYSTKNKGKEGRVAQLAVYYKRGSVYHNRTCSTVLENQLLAYPRSKFWDVMDAFSYIIQMKSLGDRFFVEDSLDDDEFPHDDPEEFEREIQALCAEDEPASMQRVYI